MQPVKMNDELIQGILQEFYAQASALGNLQTDKFSFNKNFSKPAKDAVEVNFTLEAYHEMCALIDHFSTEVAWHGLVNRIDKTHFQITKILVYPQQVTGATVNTDQEKYTTWLYELDDESFNTLRFQGHSHVNMGTSPSGVDMQNQWDLIETLSSEDYYIFMIWNKRREYNVRVVDMADNAIYSGDDVKVTIGEADTKGFLEQAEALSKSRSQLHTVATTVATAATTMVQLTPAATARVQQLIREARSLVTQAPQPRPRKQKQKRNRQPRRTRR